MNSVIDAPDGESSPIRGNIKSGPKGYVVKFKRGFGLSDSPNLDTTKAGRRIEESNED
jgi:hypothetical protein